MIDVRVTTVEGATANGAVIEAIPVAAVGAVRSARVSPQDDFVSLPAPASTVRVRVSLTGFQPVEHLVTVSSGEVASIAVRLARVGEAAASTAVDRDRLARSHQMTFNRRALERLPSSSTAWSVLETAHPFLTADRIDGGGQWPGETARLGGEGSSATQTLFRLDGVDVADPQSIGAPSIDPATAPLETLVVQSAALDPFAPGPGPIVDLAVRRPSTLWSGDARLTLAPPSLQGKAGDIAPISRLKSAGDGSVSAGGPLAGPRLGVFASGRVARAERVEREDAITFDPTVTSAMAHVVALPRTDSELRTLVSFVDAEHPLATRARFFDPDLTQRDRGLALHGSWEAFRGGSFWTLGGAWQHATTHADVTAGAAGGVIERLRDGAPLDLVAAGDTSRTRWDLRAGIAPMPVRWLAREHVIRIGASIGGAGLTSRGGAQPPFGELVNGQPARVWDVVFQGEASRRSTIAGSAFVSDRMAVADRVTVMAALRAEVDRGSAEGASTEIAWFTVTPRVVLRWRAADNFVVTSGYAWYGHRLPLSYLVVGDPAGPAGVMYRWDDRDGDRHYRPSELTAVAAVGACCTGAGPNAIDADLQRPTTGEFYIGFEQTMGSWRWGMTGLDRRERHLVALVDTGVTAADYAVTIIDDPGVDVAGRSGFQPLPIYDRRPASFLRDAYVLTNTAAEPSRYQGLEVTLARDLGPWFVRFGGSAYLSEGVGANRGYRADENDQGSLGEVFTTPNAETNARGRLFYDRAFVMKVLGAYKGRGPLGASFVARYQDGQPFARVVVADGLAQGAEIVQAYPRGGQRFTYTLTLDARVELQWKVGGRRTAGVSFEAFNLPNMDLEVEENIVTGPAFRTVIAVQPPRVVRIGLQVGF